MHGSAMTSGLRKLCRVAACLGFAAAMALLAVPAGRALAAEGGCDPAFMQSIVGRGYSAARRDSAQNKNLIYKPDSVLEYSCYFGFLTHGEQHTPMSVPAQYWDKLVTTPAFNFLANSFGHVYMGGHYATGQPWLPNGDYICSAIAKMWDFARCVNAVPDAANEDFFDLSWYINNDPRKYPPDYMACEPVMRTNDLADAYNGHQEMWLLPMDLAPDGQAYAIDPVKTYANLTSWTVNNECGEPIPTGLRIYRKDTDYDEYICAKPGCTYVPANTGKGQCVK